MEDHSEISLQLKELLKDFGAELQFYISAEDYMQAEPSEPAILFLDIRLPGLGGIELAKIYKLKYPEIKILILSSIDSDEILFQAIKAGAIGYVLKSDLEKLKDLIPEILLGGAVLTPSLAIRVLKYFREPEMKSKTGFESLTKREMDIIQELVSGLKSHEIAEELNLSPLTVSTHTKNIYRKLQVNNRIQLQKRATEMGLI